MDFEQACILTADSIFSDQMAVEIDGVEYFIEVLPRVRLRYADIEVKGEKFRVMEQNSTKTSKWAEMARKGSQIAWVFKGGRYYARVVDGIFTLLCKK